MAKWSFAYSTSDGKRGHIKITAASKLDAIRKGMEHAQKHTHPAETVKSWACQLAQA